LNVSSVNTKYVQKIQFAFSNTFRVYGSAKEPISFGSGGTAGGGGVIIINSNTLEINGYIFSDGCINTILIFSI
jgi:hypothetical protein